MAGKKGYEATKRLRHRQKNKRGGNPARAPLTGNKLARQSEQYLRSLAVLNYTPDTIEGRRNALKTFIQWATDRDLTTPKQITKLHLESYQRHLWRYRKANGKPLAISSQRQRLSTLKDYFKYLTKQNHIRIFHFEKHSFIGNFINEVKSRWKKNDLKTFNSGIWIEKDDKGGEFLL